MHTSYTSLYPCVAWEITSDREKARGNQKAYIKGGQWRKKKSPV